MPFNGKTKERLMGRFLKREREFGAANVTQGWDW